jgi:molybdopterin-guanine dinucleotide biosynthesis protein A
LSLLQADESIDVAGFVLAGGESSRMGQDKALITFAGKPLIAHALAVLRDARLQPAIAGARSALSSFAPVVEDSPGDAGRGPLSGICGALRSASARLAVFLPVDLPLIPYSLIGYLVFHAFVTGSPVTVASVNGHPQTFPVVIERRALDFLEGQLDSGERGCLAAFRRGAEFLASRLSILPAEALVQSGQIAHSASLPPAFWFLNLNTPADLARAESLASGAFE